MKPDFENFGMYYLLTLDQTEVDLTAKLNKVYVTYLQNIGGDQSSCPLT